MLWWLLVTLLAWCVTSVAVAFGLGWLIRRYPPQTPERTDMQQKRAAGRRRQ